MSLELPPLDIAPLTPYSDAADPDWDLAVVSHAAMFTLRAKRSRSIKAFIVLIKTHLLWFTISQDSLPLGGKPMFILS
jgi:hypothetical protein